MNDVMKEVYFALAKLAIIVAIALGLCAIARYGERRSAIEERAAYLEGRWGIDHETAVVFAEEEEEVSPRERGHRES